MNISVVVPVYNEVDNIVPLINEIRAVMQHAEAYEIIYVDDGSIDATAERLSQAQQMCAELRVIQHLHSYGQSAAIYSGVKAARYPYIATLDGDGQNDPADIPRLYMILTEQQQVISQLCMVAGWRNKRQDTLWRRFSSKLANSVRASLLGDHAPDTGCGLKIFLKEVFLTLPYFDHMHRFLPALILRAGGQVISEPVNHRQRATGRSKYGTLDRLRAGIIDVMGVMWLQKRAKIIKANEK